MQPLTPKQQRFAREYVLDHNGAGAAVRAGYARRSAKEIATELLTKPHVQTAVAAQEALVAAEMGVTRQKVIRELQEAVDEARRIGDPMAMIAAWREIARICGLYAPERVTVGIEADPSTAAELRRMETLSDAELAVLAAGQSGVVGVEG